MLHVCRQTKKEKSKLKIKKNAKDERSFFHNFRNFRISGKRQTTWDVWVAIPTYH